LLADSSSPFARSNIADWPPADRRAKFDSSGGCCNDCSGCSGDANGRLIPDPEVFPDLSGLAAELNSSLGVYVIPGTFVADGSKTIRGTSLTLRSTWKHQDVKNFSKFCRMEMDYTKPGVQEWHNSVVDLLCEEYSVRYMKLDFICPTSSPDGCEGFPDSRRAVEAYHTAIQQSKCRSSMRLGLSWMLDWHSESLWSTWNENADSMRLDEDINNSGKQTELVSFATVQRAIERYRVFVNSLAQSLVNGGAQHAVRIRPDMDNTFLANNITLSGLHDAQRWTMAMYWIGAGANLFEGGDLTQVDALGRTLLSDPAVHGSGGITDQFADHPMQPRNPHVAGNTCKPHWAFVAGGGQPQQLQAWIAGPNAVGDSLVIVSNLGPDERPIKGGTFQTECKGSHTLSISFAELGLPAASAGYNVSVVWDGRDMDGVLVAREVASTEVTAKLGPWESVMYKLTRMAG
jgi:alpha-galactosidase